MKVISVIFLLFSFSVFSNPLCQGDQAGQSDLRLDLLFALQLQTGYFLNNQYDIPLKAKYKTVKFDAKTLDKFRGLTGNGFKFSTLPAYFLSLNCELNQIASVPASEVRLPADKEKLFADFVSSLSDELSHGLINQLVVLPGNFDIDHALHASLIKKTKAALRTKFNRFPQDVTVLLHPLLHDGGFFIKVGDVAYSLIGPTSTSGNKVDFGPQGRIIELVAHELSHGVVDQTVYSSDVTDCQGFSTELFRQTMKKNGYIEVKTIVTEHMVRAIVLNVLKQLEPAFMVEVAKREQNSGYKDLRQLAAMFERENDIHLMFTQTKKLFSCH
ncbi:DUF4932 domain-containing protein [Rheinheimera sp.]|uniref:DUF4932 domain-containing protein n=1 Tax=Rheinheimera sp. TaxID=1869214 RepID=UPI00307E1BD0